MNRVTHFEIHADDPERAIGFYRDLFGWKFKKWEGPLPYWLVITGADDQPGINGGLVPRQGEQEGNAVIAYVCTIDVGDLDDSMSRTSACGGQIVVPKNAIPGVGWLAYAKDTEGNIFGMMQTDPTAC